MVWLPWCDPLRGLNGEATTRLLRRIVRERAVRDVPAAWLGYGTRAQRV